jgi:hypothetical protein
LTEKLSVLPVCESGYILRALEAILSGKSVPLCLPPGVDVQGLLESDALNLRGEVNAYLVSVPDEVDALALLAPAARSRLLSALNDLRAARQRSALALTALGAGLLALFLLIGLLRRKPWRSLFQWWGWTLLLAGGLALSVFGLAYAGRAAVWMWIVTSPNGALPAALSPLAKMVFMGILPPVWRSVLFTSGVAAAVGLFLVLLAFALPRGRGVSGQV